MENELPAPATEDLYRRAQELAGRPVTVDQLNNGDFIVLWMSFGVSPPHAAKSEVEALQNFITMLETQQLELPPELSAEELHSLKFD